MIPFIQDIVYEWDTSGDPVQLKPGVGNDLPNFHLDKIDTGHECTVSLLFELNKHIFIVCVFRATQTQVCIETLEEFGKKIMDYRVLCLLENEVKAQSIVQLLRFPTLHSYRNGLFYTQNCSFILL